MGTLSDSLSEHFASADYYPNFDLANFKRKIWNLKTIEEVENFLLWNQSVLTPKNWNKLLDYMLKNLDIENIEINLNNYRF